MRIPDPDPDPRKTFLPATSVFIYLFIYEISIFKVMELIEKIDALFDRLQMDNRQKFEFLANNRGGGP